MSEEVYEEKKIAFIIFYLTSFDGVTIAIMSSLKLSLCILIWPCRVILFSIHNYLTGRAYTYSLDDLCDMVIALSILVWTYSYIAWSNVDLGMTEEERQRELPHVTRPDHVYVLHLYAYDNTYKVRYLYLLAIFVFFMWLRFLMMTQLTKSFGPMLRIIITMFSEVLKFIFIWSILLVLQASVASILFGELP